MPTAAPASQCTWANKDAVEYTFRAMLVNHVADMMKTPKGGKTKAFEALAEQFKNDPKWIELKTHPPSATTIADWAKRGEAEWQKAPRAGVSWL